MTALVSDTDAPITITDDGVDLGLLGPAIAERSDEIEQAGRLPADIVGAMVPTGAFRQWVPQALDGPGRSAMEGLRVIEEFAYHDGAAGWCVAIATTSSLMSSFLPLDWARTIYGPAGSITGGFAAANGRAIEVDGGLQVTGRWQWGSGSQHCTWVGGGSLIVNGDGKPSPRPDGLIAPFVFFEPDDVTFIDDSWRVSGLEGTGSVDYEVAEVFVPEGRWVQLGMSPAVVESALTRFSFYGMLALGVASAAVGIARRSIDEFVDLAARKGPMGAKRMLNERAPVQADTAMAEAKLRSAWCLIEDVVGRAWLDAVEGRDTTDEQRRSLRLAATHATQTSAEVAELMYKAAGGAAVYRTSPLQRCFRDTFVATQHAMVAPRMHEVAGRMRLGLDTDTRLL